jgi:CubicO group peptidase (beta-lactamase class C family)
MDPPIPPIAPISGYCHPGFEAVRDQFAHNFAGRGEVGAGVCVLVDQEVVVDLVGGWADQARLRPWGADTLVNFYSVGKPLVALLALQLVDSGLIGLDDPLVSVWPEFGAGGKGTATLRQALCHRAAVPAIREPLVNDDLWDWDRMTGALAATEAWWEPGTRHAYHTNTYGHLIGEVVRRVSGETCGARLRAVAAPLGAEVWFGVDPADQRRCAEVIVEGSAMTENVGFAHLSGDELMVMLGYFNPAGYSSMGVVNTGDWRSAEVPSTNGHGTAGGIARLYAALLEPGRVLSPELLAEATSPQSQGYCPVLGEEVTFGLGFKPTTPRRPFGPFPGGFGHFGTGGAVGFADPQSGVAFGYAMNHVIPRWQSSRNRALIDALYRSMEQAGDCPAGRVARPDRRSD